MSKSDPQLAARRTARNVARAEFLRDLGQVKVDLSPTVLKRRATAEAQRQALCVAHQAIDIASDSRGIVAATGATLALWLARKPIFAGASALKLRIQARKSPVARTKLLIADYWHKLKDYADE